MTDIASPPATGVWYDLDVTAANVLARLRLQGGDVDSARIRALVPTAGLAIDNYVDGETVLDGPPPAPDVQNALECYTVELYRSDPAGQIAGYLPPQTDTYLRGVLDSLIAPRRQRWAVS